MNPFLGTIGETLTAERKKRRLNQTDAGQAAGLPRREISEIENGIYKGSILKVQDYAAFLGYSLTLEIKRRPKLSELEAVFDEN